MAGFADLEEAVDFIACSVHPFMSGLLADSFPDDYLDQLFALTIKPIGVSESSYPAQEWSIDATIWYGTPEKQNHFAQLLLDAAHRHDAAFVIWFAIRDYDQLWTNLLGMDDVSLVWRDTGLYDEAGTRRIAGDTWRQHLARQRTP